jgi:hypothetical protein
VTPVLRRDLKRHLQVRYDEARSDLVRKLMLYSEGAIAARLPDRGPYTLDQVLGDFWPASQRDGEAAS